MWVISFLEFLMNSVMWTRKGRAVRFVPWPKNAVSTFMNYNLCEIWTENFLTQLKSSGGRFAEDAWVHEIVRECVHEIIRECVRNFRRMKTSGNLRLGKLGLGAGFGPPKWEYIHSVIFTNEGKSHEWTESKARRHKSGFKVWTNGKLANISS
jgi:hypothetical protein